MLRGVFRGAGKKTSSRAEKAILELEDVGYPDPDIEVPLEGQGFQLCAFCIGVDVFLIAVVGQEEEVQFMLPGYLVLSSDCSAETVEVGVFVTRERIVGVGECGLIPCRGARRIVEPCPQFDICIWRECRRGFV